MSHQMESSHDECLTSLSEAKFLEIAKGKSAVNSGGEHRSIWTKIKETLSRDSVLVSCCVFSVLLDPLFLYVPLINEDSKCLVLDKKLKIIALVLRALTDIPYILQMIVHLCSVFRLSWERWTRNCVIDILAILPIPQIEILIFLPKMRGSRYLDGMKAFNLLILLQYFARVRPIYAFCMKFNQEKLDDKGNNKEKIVGTENERSPCLFNFFLFILASHVIGALWYFYSIQREIHCWVSACRSENGCQRSIIGCDDNSSLKNVTLLNDLCPINPSNAAVFDFGIFLYALQSGIVGSTDFPQKLFLCFSWGMRNMSSFASNLNTSTYAWESLFVIFISISGLLLFIYLLGHVQTFMQTTYRTHRIWQKRKIIYPKVDSMASEYGLDNLKWAIWELVKKELEEDEDLALDNIFSILPLKIQKQIKHHLFSVKLKDVPGLEDFGEEKLNAILEKLEPRNYTAGSYIIREGEPHDMMIFISQGSCILTNKTNTDEGISWSSTICAKGAVFGQELITWAAEQEPASLPISTKTVKSHKNVEVFVIMAADLLKITPSANSNAIEITNGIS